MSSHRSGAGSVTLKELAAQDGASPPPYGYEEFSRRNARALSQRRVIGWSAAASLASLGVLIGLSLQESRISRVAAPAAAWSEPALIEVDHYALRADLEDRIAWFDTMLSTGRKGSVAEEDFSQLQSARRVLAESLQQVNDAHALLEY
jgi:hypothetical protein